MAHSSVHEPITRADSRSHAVNGAVSTADSAQAIHLNQRQRQILKMQQTQGNAAVCRMLVQRDDDDDPYADVPDEPAAATPNSDASFAGVSSTRQAVVTGAKGEVGKVIAKKKGDIDPDTQKPLRFGWEDLDKYFTASYGGKNVGGYTQNLQDGVKFFSQAPVTRKDATGKDVTSIEPSIPQHWCGHFAMWALRNANALSASSKWQIGSGIGGVSGISQVFPKTKVKAGDVGFVNNGFEHHFIVADVQGGNINTVEGNSGGDSSIQTNSRAIADVYSFYRPKELD